jgi:TonB family protein
MQSALTALVITLSIAIPSALEQGYYHVTLIAPPLNQPEPYRPPAVPKVKMTPVETPKIPEVAKVDIPKIIVPATVLKKLHVDDVSPVKVTPVAKFDAPIVKDPAKPLLARQVETTNFGGSSATPTLPANTPARKVQTGGFGDPEGARPNPNAPASRMSIARAGSSFDLAEGPGTGNGTGGTRGKVGTVASAGFGNGVAVQGGGGTARQGIAHIQNTSFGAAAPVPEPSEHRRSIPEVAATTPVSITSKPSPQYTDEARRLKVEGEVLVKVLFTASGEVRVLSVVRGLGHGLDESAIRAAQNVRFNPALRNGQPVDSTATLHIIFQLS